MNLRARIEYRLEYIFKIIVGHVLLFMINLTRASNIKKEWDTGVMVANEPVHEISNNVVCATSKASNQPAHTRSLIRAFASRFSIL